MSYAEQARSLAAYNRWADDHILAIAGELAPDAIASDCADGRSIDGTLRHALMTQTWWLGNWTGVPRSRDDLREILETPRLADVYAKAHDAIDALINRTPEERWAEAVEFKFPNAPSLRLPMWQTFAQVMLHGVQHRAQLAAALTALGRSPDDMDYILWLLRINRTG